MYYNLFVWMFGFMFVLKKKKILNAKIICYFSNVNWIEQLVRNSHSEVVLLEKASKELAQSSVLEWKCSIEHVPPHNQGHLEIPELNLTKSVGLQVSWFVFEAYSVPQN